MSSRGVVLLALLAGSGCAMTHYDWGSYQKSVARMYSSPESFELGVEIQMLEKEVRRTEARGKLVPPGKYAHLAYLFYLNNDLGGARKYFLAEKAAFPESAIFVDGMLERMP